MLAMKKILVPVDFSMASTLALSYAGGLARRFGGTLYLVHVVDEIVARDLRPTRIPEQGPTRLEREREAIERMSAMLTAEDQTVAAPPVILSSGLPAFAIVEYAKSIGADEIVIAPHDRSTARCLFLGFATERIIRTAPCPVFVVPDPAWTVAEAPERHLAGVPA